MLIVTTQSVPGREIDESLGLVIANTVRARHIGRDILAGLKGLVGGEIGAYKQLMLESREQALAELEQEAASRGADAIVGVRLMTSNIADFIAEVYIYGTAVTLKAPKSGAGDA